VQQEKSAEAIVSRLNREKGQTSIKDINPENIRRIGKESRISLNNRDTFGQAEAVKPSLSHPKG